MKVIGPYVVNREVSPARRSGTTAQTTLPISVRTLWVTDRLTGMPALLHELTSPIPAPELPQAPTLLPFNDLTVEGKQAFLVTELPLNAVPATDPLLAARAALSALETLHAHGLAHGALDTGQLWSVDGRVVLVGGGLHPLGDDFSVDRDLRDLAATLDDLGGLPPILSLLRQSGQAPGGQEITAHEARQLLETGLQAHPVGNPLPQATATVPALHPLSLLDNSAPLPQQGPYLWQASWTPLDSEVPPAAQIESHAASAPTEWSTGGPATQPTTALENGSGFQLNISEWTFPEFLDEAASSAPATPAPPPVVVTAAPIVLQWAKPNREAPTSQADSLPPAAETPASAPVAPTGSTEVIAAVVPPVNYQANYQATASAEPAPAATPEARPNRPGFLRFRRSEAAGSRAADRLRADATRAQNLAQARQSQSPTQWEAAAAASNDSQGTPAETPQERRRRKHEAFLAQSLLDAQQATEHKVTVTPAAAEPLPAAAGGFRRELKPIRATWTSDQQWKVVHDGEEGSANTPKTAAPSWLWPWLLALAITALAVGALISRQNNRNQQTAPAAASACCSVEFKLLGQNAAGKTANLTLESAPQDARMTAGQKVGTAPGTIRVPVAGTYRVRVTADGFSPASVNFVAPSNQAVQINLGN